MKFNYIISVVLAASMVMFSTNYGECSIVLNEGDAYSFEFTSLPYHKEYNEPLFGFAQVTLSSATETAPSFRFSVYENILEENPIRTSIYGMDPERGVIGFGFIINSDSAPWQDLQGIFFIEVITGAIELESFTAATVINNGLYIQTYAVPLPNSFVFTISGILLITIVHFRNRKYNIQPFC